MRCKFVTVDEPIQQLLRALLVRMWRAQRAGEAIVARTLGEPSATINIVANPISNSRPLCFGNCVNPFICTFIIRLLNPFGF